MYKKRIKDWGIDKNLKSDRLSTSPRSNERQGATHIEPRSSVRITVSEAQKMNNYVEYRPDLAQQPQYGILPSAEGAMKREYHTPTSTFAAQQHNAGYCWASPGQSHADGSYSPSLAQSFEPAEQGRNSSVLLNGIRDRFLQASDAITRQDTAVLFDILNPAYEAISNVAETEADRLLDIIVDLFEMLYRRPNHQDMLRQLLQYVFALVPDAVRQNQFLSCNSQVLTLLGRSDYDSQFGAPLDTAGGTDSRPTVSPHNYDYYEQRSGAGPAFDNGFGGNRRHPY